jgi:hypothetical protein
VLLNSLNLLGQKLHHSRRHIGPSKTKDILGAQTIKIFKPALNLVQILHLQLILELGSLEIISPTSRTNRNMNYGQKYFLPLSFLSFFG